MTASATLPERAKLIEAALRSSNPQAFLTGLQSAFQFTGRIEDFSTAATLCDLFGKREIERILHLKRRWEHAPVGPNPIK